VNVVLPEEAYRVIIIIVFLPISWHVGEDNDDAFVGSYMARIFKYEHLTFAFGKQ